MTLKIYLAENNHWVYAIYINQTANQVESACSVE